ncbi:Stk1 family PASTA domain-containing Ser/Thr kinase [[Clostridium] polysaccharolyticum]|uniref:non-specific serine/threonine protein kinase n=1 Tax=[Clostridium] polysaccharolyticum TaxID=29364 RepID=A0A1H9Y0T4_9FIRM|nr:Stk1 family PASTA domain-containing Ser/Thr kinase [[Clostridium] polysaccharolyticum]SES62283.1 serine/threonine protein kinase [[Clostridium] polysaccharolyticum]
MVRPGMLISDRYEIIEKVGTGGMADVYKAKCHRLNRFVAIKVLKAEYSEDENFVEKFRGEAQSAAGLSHPNIVNVYDVGDDDGLHYIVMELVEGITLKSFIERKGKLDVKEVLGISIQIAQGMEAAHANHIVHRDIKPQNIIISREGKVKVTDFGIAKAATSNTITSNAMGSVHYISPEQARGGYSDDKSDIYSLGITMYEMLSGRVPFTGENTISVALLHIQGEAASLRDLDPTIPISIDKIVQKCMQKKPERRYPNVSELIKDLRLAITNPNDDFVKIPPMVIVDSPTIHISDDEINHIKSASKENQNIYHDLDEPEEAEDDKEDDEDDEEDIDPKVEKMLHIGGAVVGVVLVGLIVFIIFKVFIGGSGSDKPVLPSAEPSVTQEAAPSPATSEAPSVNVPDVVGKSLEEAKTLLEEAKVKYTIENEYSSFVKAGNVISTDPKAGEEIPSDKEVVVTVSRGTQKLEVPNVAGKSVEDAVRELEAAGFAVKKDTANSDSVEEGKVVYTEPKAGSETEKGATITVFESLGAEVKYVYVPDLTNQTQADAESRLKSSNLVLGKVRYKNSDTYKEGKVIDQTYSVNSKVEEGTAIGVTISLGPKKKAVYKYYGDAVVTYNPFDFEDESGKVEIILSQSGHSKTVYSEECTYGDFPLPLSDIEGYDESNGTLTMYVDGEQRGDSISISFTKVEQ